MKYTKLGKSDLTVSRICMGCMGFGAAGEGQHSWTLDEEHSREIIKRGIELGINFYDTAIAYQSGTSEQYVGRALKDFAKRDEMVVATKFLPRTQEEIEAGVSGQQHIEKMINKTSGTWEWTMLTFISTICGIIRHQFMIFWKVCLTW